MAAYTITPDPDETGASIQFPRDRELIDSLKRTFPKARWNREAKSWHVPGVRAQARLEKWATAHVPAERPFENERLRDELQTFAPINSPVASYHGGQAVIVTTPYDPQIVTLLRAIPGAAWNSTAKKWFIPLERRSIDALRASLPAIEELVRAAQAAREELEAKWAAEKAAQRAKWDAEKAADKQARDVRRAHRRLYPNRALPPMHAPVRWGESWIVYESTGRDFRISEDDPSCFGSHLLGHEGEYGCYCYYRDATPEEIAAAETAAAEARAAREAEKARRDELRATWDRISNTGERPDGTDNVAQGRQVYLTQTDHEGAPYGFGSSLVVGERWVWALMNNGSDGADWRANNVRTGGAGAIGWRIPADAALAARIMELGEACGTLVPDYA